MVFIARLGNGLAVACEASAGYPGCFAGCRVEITLFSGGIVSSEHCDLGDRLLIDQLEEAVFTNRDKTPLLRALSGRFKEGSPEGSGEGPGEPSPWLTLKWIPALSSSEEMWRYRTHPVQPPSLLSGRGRAVESAVYWQRADQVASRRDRVRAQVAQSALDDRTGSSTPPVTFRTSRE